jgi:anti-sigma B factor antagonist
MERERPDVVVNHPSPAEAVFELRGEINVTADEALSTAYAGIGDDDRRIVLDFGGVSYINSTGIALVVRLLAEARRDRREVVAVGLSEHYREIFRITRLSDYMTIADGEPADAVEEAAR